MPNSGSLLERFMRPVTSRAVAGLFTSAKEHCLVFLSQKDQGFQIVCLLMGPVAKWLVCAQATGTPSIFLTFFHVNFVRAVLSNYRVGHKRSLRYVKQVIETSLFYV